MLYNPSRLFADRHATSAIEFALVAPVLVLLLFGVVDYAALASRSLQVRGAAHAAASEASRHGWDARAIEAAGVRWLDTLQDGAVNAVLLTHCAGHDVPAASARCADGARPGRYVRISVTAASPPLVLRSATLIPQSVEADALVRIG